jgi:hypothetical protein
MTAPNHPWNPLAVEPRGDFEPDTLYAAVGRALSAWEMMEGILANVFALLCRAEFEGAVRAYGAVAAFSGRKSMLEEAFACFPDRGKDGVKELPALLAKIQQFSGRRNEIAHGVVWYFSANQKSLGNYLVPATYNSRKRISGEAYMALHPMTNELPWHVALRYAYIGAQVDYYREQFFHLTTEAMAVADALGALAYEAFEQKNGDAPGM